MLDYDFVIRTLKEMSLNYKSQYPKAIPNMDFIAKLVSEMGEQEMKLPEEIIQERLRLGLISYEDAEMSCAKCGCKDLSNEIGKFKSQTHNRITKLIKKVRFEERCECGMFIPKGYGYYNYGKLVKCFGCGKINRKEEKRG